MGVPPGAECAPWVLILCLPTDLLWGRKGGKVSLRRKWETFRGDNECMAPIHSGFLQGRQSKTFALKLEGDPGWQQLERWMAEVGGEGGKESHLCR